MATVTVKDLKISTIIGTLPHERIHRQQIIVDAAFDYDARRAAASDDLLLSVDYSAVERAIVETAEQSSFQLLEALAAQIGKAVLAFDSVTRVKISIRKPAASAFGAMICYSEEFSAGAEKY